LEIYSEEDYCKISSENTTDSSLAGFDEYVNDISYILNKTQVANHKDLKQIFYFSINSTDETESNKIIFKLNYNDDIYLDKGEKVEVKCSVFDNLDSIYIFLAVLAPFIYIITSAVLVMIYCKYKKAKEVYQKLRNEIESPEDEKSSEENGKLH
jgi:hypothetical protein